MSYLNFLKIYNDSSTLYKPVYTRVFIGKIHSITTKNYCLEIKIKISIYSCYLRRINQLW